MTTPLGKEHYYTKNTFTFNAPVYLTYNTCVLSVKPFGMIEKTEQNKNKVDDTCTYTHLHLHWYLIRGTSSLFHDGTITL